MSDRNVLLLRTTKMAEPEYGIWGWFFQNLATQMASVSSVVGAQGIAQVI